MIPSKNPKTNETSKNNNNESFDEKVLDLRPIKREDRRNAIKEMKSRATIAGREKKYLI